jgi:Zn-dependent protease with chaperone function
VGVLDGLSRFAKQVAFFGFFSLLLSKGHPLPIALPNALACAYGAGMVLSMCLNIASRAAEIRTDIRAVQLTRDLGSLAEALETIHKLIGGDDLPRFPQTLFSLSTHPSPSMRARWVRRACGYPQPASPHLRSGWLRSFR